MRALIPGDIMGMIALIIMILAAIIGIIVLCVWQDSIKENKAFDKALKKEMKRFRKNLRKNGEEIDSSFKIGDKHSYDGQADIGITIYDTTTTRNKKPIIPTPLCPDFHNFIYPKDSCDTTRLRRGQIKAMIAGRNGCGKTATNKFLAQYMSNDRRTVLLYLNLINILRSCSQRKTEYAILQISEAIKKEIEDYSRKTGKKLNLLINLDEIDAKEKSPFGNTINFCINPSTFITLHDTFYPVDNDINAVIDDAVLVHLLTSGNNGNNLDPSTGLLNNDTSSLHTTAFDRLAPNGLFRYSIPQSVEEAQFVAAVILVKQEMSIEQFRERYGKFDRTTNQMLKRIELEFANVTKKHYDNTREQIRKKYCDVDVQNELIKLIGKSQQEIIEGVEAFVENRLRTPKFLNNPQSNIAEANEQFQKSVNEVANFFSLPTMSIRAIRMVLSSPNIELNYNEVNELNTGNRATISQVTTVCV